MIFSDYYYGVIFSSANFSIIMFSRIRQSFVLPYAKFLSYKVRKSFNNNKLFAVFLNILSNLFLLWLLFFQFLELTVPSFFYPLSHNRNQLLEPYK